MNVKTYLEDFHTSFCSEMASELGMQTATIYGRVRFLNQKGKRSTVDVIADGYPFLSVNQVKHSLRVLEKNGYLTASKPNLEILDHTKYYTAVL